MRRFVSLAILLFFTVPFGVSVIGCGHKAAPVQFCSSGDSGPAVGQVSNISFSTQLSTVGESLNYGQIGQVLSPTATDCKGSTVSVTSYTYASSDLTIADINPKSGQVCAGTWNRFTGGGIPDFTFCTAPTTPNPAKFVAYLTASAQGATSNVVPVYVHPVATSVAIGTPSASCTTDPSSNCCSFNTPLQAGVPTYDGSSCVSQNHNVQLAARVYANGTTNPADNITCSVGHLTFSPQGSTNIVTIDPSTGIATANQPGSATITTSISTSGSGSNAGFFSTCPPASIVLTAPGKTGSNITLALNNPQPLSVQVLDTNNNQLTGLTLEYNSTTPQIIPAGSAITTAAFPGSATITAVCQPGTCNPSPYSQIGLYGNGKPITSNGITFNATGTSSGAIYAGSTSSQYIYPVDFTTGQPPSLVKLPYAPNSMVLSEDGSTLYLGSDFGMMTYSTAGNGVGSANPLLPGKVLSVSPDNSTVVVTDPIRQTVSLVSSSGSISATYGGVGVASQWSPDSQTVYIAATNNTLLVHSTFTGWSSITTGTNYKDIAVTVPHVGAYFAGGNMIDGRSYCENTTVTAGTPPTTNNTFYPLADQKSVPSDHVIATTDGKHILTAGVTPTAALNDLTFTTTTLPVGACPQPGQSPVAFSSTSAVHPLSSITATAINGLVSATSSSLAFVTYTGTSGLLPVYIPSTGALSYITLSGGVTSAPVSGVFSTDNQTFYAGTSGDNKIHLITIQGTTGTDSSTINPALPDANGNIVAPNLLAQRPKKSTS